MNLEHAETLYSALKTAGINFAAYLPDDRLNALQKMVLERGEIQTVPATNEGEAICLCAGAWFGGKRPAAIIADVGLLVGSYPIGSLLVSRGIPVLLLIAHRGAVGDAPSWLFMIYQYTTQPVLDALHIPAVPASQPLEAAEAIRRAQKSATIWQHPVAVLLSGEVLE